MAIDDSADEWTREISASLQPIARSEPSRTFDPGERRNVLLLAGTSDQVTSWRRAWRDELGEVAVLKVPQDWDEAVGRKVDPPWQLEVLSSWEWGKAGPSVAFFRDRARTTFGLAI